MSAAVALQIAVYDALIGSSSVAALIGDRVFDDRPSDADFPCITFGPAQDLPDDSDCIPGEEHILQLDTWDRSGGKTRNAKMLNSTVKSVLHDASLNLSDPYALAFIRVTDVRVMQDPDGLTAHGIVTIRASIEVIPVS